MSHRTTDLGWRVEVRAASPDPSLPSAGRLLGYAQRTGSFWLVQVREHHHVTFDTRTGAVLALLAIVEAGEAS